MALVGNEAVGVLGGFGEEGGISEASLYADLLELRMAEGAKYGKTWQGCASLVETGSSSKRGIDAAFAGMD